MHTAHYHTEWLIGQQLIHVQSEFNVAPVFIHIIDSLFSVF